MAIHSEQRPVDLLLRELGPVILPKPRDWWVIHERLYGEINGIPSFRGRAAMTNGIHVLLVNEQSSSYVIGHWEWFLADEDSEPELVKSASNNKAKVPSAKARAFVELFLD